MNALDYCLKANLYGLLFAGSYWLLLRRHTFFSLNRAYLLTSAILSLVLPLVSLPTQTVETLPVRVPLGIITLPAIPVAASPVGIAPDAAQPDWAQIGLLAYGLIALVLVVCFLIRIGRLLRLIRQSVRQAHEDYVLVLPNDPTIPTFSFFRYVMLNPADTRNDLIIQHELVHVRQYHSADVVGLGLIKSIFWACPALWLIERLLRQAHEFLADKPVSQPTEYARFLVDYSFGTHLSLSSPDKLTNSFFNPSLLRQRIIMLHRKATNRWALGKYALVLPLAFGLLAMTATRKEIASMVSQPLPETITVSGRVTSATDGKPLSGVSIMDGKRLFKTDQKGYYQFTDLQNPSTLMFSYTGFKAVTHKITHPIKLNISLQAISEELPTMGATAMYKSIKPNPNMPVRTPPSSEKINGKVYSAVAEPAVFPTGIPGLMQYVAHHLHYPPNAKAAGIQGDVFVLFTVLSTGAVGEVKVNKNIERIGGGCEEEAIRIVRQMPRWIPAQQNGKAVAVRFQIPIRFALEKKEDKRTGRVDPPIFKPTDSPIGEFPAIRDINYPNQPRITMVKVPAKFFKADTTPQPDSEKQTGDIIDNSKNGRFALYNDVQPVLYSLPDSLRQKPDKKVWLHSPNPGPDPLLIINGVESSQKELSKVVPNDIQSIIVLKNSAANAYGIRGKDGVILITTKKK